MLLSVTDRFLMMDLLPQQGNIVTLRVVREARQALEFQADETTRYDLSFAGGNVRWDPAKAEDVDIPLSEAALEIARTAIRKLDAEQKLSANHIPLWEKLGA